MFTYVTFGVLLDCSTKAAVLLVVALLVSLAMRRASAASRHLLWCAALSATLLIPLLSVLLPQWQVLPGWAAETSPARPAALPQYGLSAEQTAKLPPAAVEWLTRDQEQQAPVPAFSESVRQRVPVTVRTVTVGSGQWRWLTWTWRDWVCAAWFVGVIVCVMPVVLGTVRLSTMRRRSTRAMDMEARCNASTPVLLSRQCHMPMVVGIFRPATVLPADAENWSSGRLQAVIAHERAHAVRLDCLWQLVGQLARAMYWFNPLAWLALSRLLAESERACDDAALHDGSRPSEYAEHLLSVATAGRSGAFLSAAAIAMAGPNRLEGRLLAILDHSRSRSRTTLAMVILIGGPIGGLAVPLAMLRAEAPAAGEVKATVAAKPAGEVPTIIETTPGNGATNVDPGLTELKVVFDQPMDSHGFSWVGGGPAYPKLNGKAHWIDEKTCVLPVILESGHDYWFSINNPSFTNFRSKSGVPAEPHPVWFQTAGADANGKRPLGPPKVEKMQPAAGATDVDPAVTELRVTFDQPMESQGFSWVGGGESFPKTTGAAKFIDERTCILPVKLEPGHEYRLSINSYSFLGFGGKNGVPATPYPVTFKTRGVAKAAPVAQAAIRVVCDVQGNLMAARQLTDWDSLRVSLASRSDLAKLYLEVAIVADEKATLGRFRDAKQQAMTRGDRLVRELKMAYLSDVGDATPDERSLLARLVATGLHNGQDLGSLTPAARDGKLQDWVELFFASNYRDITARRTIDWGQATKDASGNWSIRYKYEATIWDKDKVVQDKTFTFTPEGGFVSVKDASPLTPVARPDKGNLPPLNQRKVDKTVAQFAEQRDLSLPETAWAAWHRANAKMDAQAVGDLSWVKIPLEEEKAFWQRGMAQDPEGTKTYAQAVADAKLVEVWIDRDELADTVCYLPFPAGKGRNPYSIRVFGKINGEWKNLGEDRAATLEEAREMVRSKQAGIWEHFQSLKATAVSEARQADKVITAKARQQADALSHEGWALWGKGQFGPATERFREAVKLDPAAANTWNGLGWALFNSGDRTGARDAFAKCIELAPSHPGALNGRGQVALAEGNFAAAEKDLLSAAPTAPAAWWGLAKLYLAQGKYDEAVKWCDRIVKEQPNNADALMLQKAAQSKQIPPELKRSLPQSGDAVVPLR